MVGIRVNFSDEDKATEGRSAIYNALPTGDYECVISDMELKQVGPNSENAGKPMFKVTLTVENNDEADYNGRKFWPNVMLFETKGGNFFLAQFLKATGNADALNTGIIPDAEAFLGKSLIATVKRVRDSYAMKDAPEGAPMLFKNEVKGFLPLGGATATTKTATKRSGKSSFMP